MTLLKKAAVLTAIFLLFVNGLFAHAVEIRTEYTADVTLYYPAEGSSRLLAVQCRITLKDSERMARKLIRDLMEEQKPAGAVPLFGAGARLETVEDSLQVVTVYVNTAAPVDDRLQALSTFALWQTLSQCREVQGINVMVDGCAASYRGMCLNTLCSLRSVTLEFDALLQSAQSNRVNTVYLPEASGRWLIPVLKDMGDAAAPAEEKLLKLIFEKTIDAKIFTVWPQEVDFSTGVRYNYGYTEQNRRCLYLQYTEQTDAPIRLADAYRDSGMQQWQLIASIVRTLCINLPYVERVSIRLLGTQIVTLTDVLGTVVTFEGGEVAERVFRGETAAVLQKLVYNDETGKFGITSSLLGTDKTSSNRNILAACVPDELDSELLNSVLAAQDKAVIDLNCVFYAKMQSSSTYEEMRTVYAIVNAAELNLGIKTAFFTVEGMKADTLAGTIILNEELHPNYGLME